MGLVWVWCGSEKVHKCADVIYGWSLKEFLLCALVQPIWIAFLHFFFRPIVKKEEGGTVSDHFKDEDYFFKPPTFINPRIKMKIDENKAIDEKEATDENEFIEHNHEEHEYVFNSEYDYDPEYLVDDYETEKPKIITEHTVC